MLHDLRNRYNELQYTVKARLAHRFSLSAWLRVGLGVVDLHLHSEYLIVCSASDGCVHKKLIREVTVEPSTFLEAPKSRAPVSSPPVHATQRQRLADGRMNLMPVVCDFPTMCDGFAPSVSPQTRAITWL